MVRLKCLDVEERRVVLTPTMSGCSIPDAPKSPCVKPVRPYPTPTISEGTIRDTVTSSCGSPGFPGATGGSSVHPTPSLDEGTIPSSQASWFSAVSSHTPISGSMPDGKAVKVLHIRKLKKKDFQKWNSFKKALIILRN